MPGLYRIMATAIQLADEAGLLESPSQPQALPGGDVEMGEAGAGSDSGAVEAAAHAECVAALKPYIRSVLVACKRYKVRYCLLFAGYG